MADIKRTFLKGKMNKDLDERLLPSDVYRDALNVRVTNSDGSDVGAVENIKGNVIASNILSHKGNGPNTAKIVGSIADTTHNKVYYFVHNYNELNEQGLGVQGDAIIEYDVDTKVSKVVFNDIYKVVGDITPSISSNQSPLGPFLNVSLPDLNMFSSIKPGMDIDFLEAGQQVGDADVEVEEALGISANLYTLTWTSLPSWIPYEDTVFPDEAYILSTWEPEGGTSVTLPNGLSIVDGHFHVSRIAAEAAQGGILEFEFKIETNDGEIPEDGFPTPVFTSDSLAEDNQWSLIDPDYIGFPTLGFESQILINPEFNTETGYGKLKISHVGMSSFDYDSPNVWRTARVASFITLENGSTIQMPQQGLLTNVQMINYDLDPQAQHQLTITQGLSGSFIDPSVYGCTDPSAENFNDSATIDDGSCTYPAMTAG